MGHPIGSLAPLQFHGREMGSPKDSLPIGILDNYIKASPTVTTDFRIRPEDAQFPGIQLKHN